MNSPNESILELTTIDHQWVQAFTVMQQLRTDLTEKSFLDLLHEIPNMLKSY
ncbi:hypothetical protein [Paenisporosarcina antarctica]|uniref:hypothetical protein n=1 Tax=Paenisporosarcina antarctica TaxID=417367 RepID=UPI001AB032DB|nr:hypothetical protein [Paenisporosarcina antarctica]